MNNWSEQSVFYHIYPLGFCSAPQGNDFSAPPQNRIRRLCGLGGYLKNAGFNAVYLGPVFESTTHGYDTADYFNTDRRLGTNADLAETCADLKNSGMKLVFDAVFNHVGRDFWAFRDVREQKTESPFRSWFAGLDFSRRNGMGDPFAYDTWQGHENLVKLNLSDNEVRNHLFAAAENWIQTYDIDGLRLDAADCMDKKFLSDLAARCRALKPDFWLMGEVVHGNYRDWANPDCIDSVTNYEAYKGLYSSFNDANFFEIAWTLRRLFGRNGICAGTNLYSFADNHDVDRIASTLKDRRHLHPLYCLLFAMPGIPSVYYGSEFGIDGKKQNGSDAALRPPLDPRMLAAQGQGQDVASTIARLSAVRAAAPALRTGDYTQLAVSAKQLAFLRTTPEQSAAVFINASDKPCGVECDLGGFAGKTLRDLLNPGWSQPVTSGKMTVNVDGNWARILEIA